MEKYIHKVQYYETDKMQITHHSNYIRFMEEARTDFLTQIGWGYEKLEKEGIVSPVVDVSCEYKKTTTFSDIIEIEVKLLELTAVRLKLGYVMTVEGEIVFKATSTHCFLDERSKPMIIKKQYPEFYNALQVYLKEQSYPVCQV